MMGTLSLAALKAGMRLTADVVDRNGRKLLPGGELLTEQSLRVMKIWGVTEAQVDGAGQDGEDGLPDEISPEVYEAARHRTAERFRHNDASLPVVQELMRLCSLRLARRVSELQAEGAENPFAVLEEPVVPKPGMPQPDPVEAQALMQEDMKLGSLPSVFHKLVEVVNDSRSSATDVAEVIANDTDLAARLLRIVNSPFYGLRARIDTISRATAIIGSNQLVSLAMGVSVISSFKGVPHALVSMRHFWEHSIACGVAARILASHHRAPNTERFFVAGILHDIGRLVIYKRLPDHASHLLYVAQQRGSLVHQCEKEVVGFTHDRLAGMLLKAWKCPVSLEKNVRYHHLPGMAHNTLEAALMSVADVLANALEMGTSGERLVPVLDSAAWEALGLPVSLLWQTAVQMDYQVAEIVRLMEVDG